MGHDGDLTKSILITFTNIFSWAPSAILLSLTLVWPEYPFSLLIWTTLILIPLNDIIDPSVFVFFKLLKTSITYRNTRILSGQSEKQAPLQAVTTNKTWADKNATS